MNEIKKSIYSRELETFFEPNVVESFSNSDKKKLQLFQHISQKLLKRSKKSYAEKHRSRFQSSWGLLTNLILKGHGNTKACDCVRFGHFQLMNGILDFNKDNLKKIYQQTFLQEDNLFPWHPESAKDIRLANIQMKKPYFVCLNYKFSKHLLPQKKKNQPCVIVSELNDIKQESEIVKQYIIYHPFTIFIKNYIYNEQPVVFGQILVNHEYLDGVAAAYYLNSFLTYAGLTEIDYSLFHHSFLQKVFDEADKREHASNNNSFKVKTKILSAQASNEVIEHYNELSNIYKQSGYKLSVETYLTAYFFHLLSKNETTGCLLKFSFAIEEQLDFHAINHVKKLSKTLLYNPVEFISKYSKYITSKNHISLYHSEDAIISNLIKPLTDKTPFWALKIINKIVEKAGISRNIIGQMVITHVPSSLKKDNKYIELGHGFGGPTCAPFQDVSLTFGFIKDKNKQIKHLVLRKKCREKR